MSTNPSSNSKGPSMYLQNTDEVRKVFERFDANKDGKISADELTGVLKALGSESSAYEVARMMQEIYTDKDGHINLQEFSGDTDPYSSAEKELREAFELYDQDGDGRISAAELHKILTQPGESCSVQDCAGMIKSVDSAGDGYVGFEEFRKMMATAKKLPTHTASF